MKKYALSLLIALFIIQASIAQSGKLFGTWELKYHILANGDTCRYNKITITFNTNYSFLEVVNGSKFKGKWRLRNDTIMYYDCSEKSIIKHDIIENYYQEFHISKDGILIQKEGVCSEIKGTSYYFKR